MKFATYDDYLLSDKWEKVKEDFTKTLSYEKVCFFCYYQDCLQFHHWRYPKNWNNDNHNNLFLVCKFCHERIHRTDIIHDSHMYGPNQQLRYLSHIFKELSLMDGDYL